MDNPEGGHGERKDKAYFFQELDRLYKEAVSNGQKDIAIVLVTLMGSIKMGNARDLVALCTKFAEDGIKILDRKKEERLKKPKN